MDGALTQEVEARLDEVFAHVMRTVKGA
jgi:hypothetical protein